MGHSEDDAVLKIPHKLEKKKKTLAESAKTFGIGLI